jgi:DNA end-binding protein Ku
MLEAPKELDLAKYQDRYAIRLTELIQKKVAGEEIVAPPAHEQAPVINLMDALCASLAQVQKAQPEEAAKPPKKMAPSVHKAAGGATKRESG